MKKHKKKILKYVLKYITVFALSFALVFSVLSVSAVGINVNISTIDELIAPGVDSNGTPYFTFQNFTTTGEVINNPVVSLPTSRSMEDYWIEIDGNYFFGDEFAVLADNTMYRVDIPLTFFYFGSDFKPDSVYFDLYDDIGNTDGTNSYTSTYTLINSNAREFNCHFYAYGRDLKGYTRIDFSFYSNQNAIVGDYVYFGISKNKSVAVREGSPSSDSIIDSNNANTDKIINNQNENTDKIIESLNPSDKTYPNLENPDEDVVLGGGNALGSSTEEGRNNASQLFNSVANLFADDNVITRGVAFVRIVVNKVTAVPWLNNLILTSLGLGLVAFLLNVGGTILSKFKVFGKNKD